MHIELHRSRDLIIIKLEIEILVTNNKELFQNLYKF